MSNEIHVVAEHNSNEILDTSEIFCVHNKYYWTITKKRVLICIYFRKNGKTEEKLFPQIQDVNKIDVCEDANYCAARTTTGIYVANFETGESNKISEDETIRTISWFIPSSSDDKTYPYLLMGHASHQISYCCIKEFNKIKIMDIGKGQYPIIGIIARQITDGRVGIVVIEKISTLPMLANICGFVFTSDFQKTNEKINENRVFFSDALPYSFTSQHIIICNDFPGFNVFLCHLPKSLSSPKKLLECQYMISINEKPLNVYTVGRKAFIQTESGIRTYDLEETVDKLPRELTTVPIKSSAFVDPKTWTIFTNEDGKIVQRGFSKKYSGERGFIMWVIDHLKESDTDYCLKFLKSSKISPVDILRGNKTIDEKCEILSKYCVADDIEIPVKVRRDIAYIFIDLYIRNAVKKVKGTSFDKLNEMMKPALRKNLIKPKAITDLLKEYGWTSAFGNGWNELMCVFDNAMAIKDFDTAVETLKSMTKEDFVKCVLKIYMERTKECVDLMFSNDYLDVPELIPLILSDESVPHVEEFLTLRTLSQSWQRNSVAFLISKVEDREKKIELAEKYISFIHYSQEDYNFALRIWLESGDNEIVSRSMKQVGDLEGALLTCSDRVVDIIKETNDNDKRRQITVKVLRSLDKEKAAEIAKIMLDNKEMGSMIGIDILLNFLPDSTKISDLIDPADAFLTDIDKKKKAIFESREKAKKGIRNAHKRDVRIANTKVVTVAKSSTPCSLCKECIIGTSGFMFPCGHFVHKCCLNNFIERAGINAEQFKQNSSCPICGNYAAEWISFPYDNFDFKCENKKEETIDEWSVEPDDLKKLINDDTPQFLFNFPKLR